MEEKDKRKRERKLKQKMQLYHAYYLRTGLYKFLAKNIVKLIVILAAIIGVILILNSLIDLNKVLETIITSVKPIYVYILFFISESILGWIPPDFFIIWAKDFKHPYLIVTFLATISYIGGYTAYFIGWSIRKYPNINAYFERKYEKNFHLIKKWGGLVVILAALFPLPFATISTIAGMVHYPFKTFALYGITRYIRFYIYAIPIYSAMENLL